MSLSIQEKSDLDKKFLYDQGSTDSTIARDLNLTESAIKKWRKRNNLPPNKSNQGFSETKDPLTNERPIHKNNKDKNKTPTSKIKISTIIKLSEKDKIKVIQNMGIFNTLDNTDHEDHQLALIEEDIIQKLGIDEDDGDEAGYTLVSKFATEETAILILNNKLENDYMNVLLINFFKLNDFGLD